SRRHGPHGGFCLHGAARGRRPIPHRVRVHRQPLRHPEAEPAGGLAGLLPAIRHDARTHSRRGRVFPRQRLPRGFGGLPTLGNRRSRPPAGQGLFPLLALRPHGASLTETLLPLGARPPTPSFSPPRSLYIHVPFCRSKCAYCDFASGPLREAPEGLAEAVLEATLSRVDALSRRFGAVDPAAGGEGRNARPFDTLYIGGGTPTVLPRPLFRRLLAGLAARARGLIEWTVEANPESLDEEALDAMLEFGVSRLSLGVQSLDDGLLSLLGRPATAKVAEAALARAAASGLRVSADLMAGLPRATRLEEEALRLLELGAGHLSVYDLVLEEGTPLAARAAAGRLDLPGEDEAADERVRLEAALETRGFRRYEVSNYAPPGAESLHNLAYWRMDSYLGAGPGAVSTLVAAPGSDGLSLRIEEAADSSAYAERGGQGRAATETAIPAREAAFEAIMMGFRTIFGPDRAAFHARFGHGLEDLVGETLASWEERLVPAADWPAGVAGADREFGRRSLDGSGLDLLNRFLGECLEELERRFPSVS
ncbi:MAG: radical SAM family heme chaperone HemW, partial [Spirochaetaceae bacterium]|nr:radical SAM family heme chaperone HemW [Spirochaetaceae bacterium]